MATLAHAVRKPTIRNDRTNAGDGKRV